MDVSTGLQLNVTPIKAKWIPVVQCVRPLAKCRHDTVGGFSGRVQMIRKSIGFRLIAVIWADEDLPELPMIVGNQVRNSLAVDTDLFDRTNLKEVCEC